MASNSAQRAWEGKDELQRTGIPLMLARGPVGREEGRRKHEGLPAGLLSCVVFVSEGQTHCWHTCVSLQKHTFHLPMLTLA